MAKSAHSEIIRILLRNPANGLYLQPGGAWGFRRETAYGFPSVLGAYSWARDQVPIKGVEIFFAFDDGKDDFVYTRL